jgi:hypothetical protein
MQIGQRPSGGPALRLGAVPGRCVDHLLKGVQALLAGAVRDGRKWLTIRGRDQAGHRWAESRRPVLHLGNGPGVRLAVGVPGHLLQQQETPAAAENHLPCRTSGQTAAEHCGCLSQPLDGLPAPLGEPGHHQVRLGEPDRG